MAVSSGASGFKSTMKTIGDGVSSRWGDANVATKGFLNPTAIGAGTGMVAGGAYGGLSDNGSVLGGMAGGAMLGAGLGAGGYAGFNKAMHGKTWSELGKQDLWKDTANKKFSQFTNPAYHI